MDFLRLPGLKIWKILRRNSYGKSRHHWGSSGQVVKELDSQSTRVQNQWVAPRLTQPSILSRSIKQVPAISGNLVVKSKLPPRSGSSLDLRTWDPGSRTSRPETRDPGTVRPGTLRPGTLERWDLDPGTLGLWPWDMAPWHLEPWY